MPLPCLPATLQSLRAAFQHVELAAGWQHSCMMTALKWHGHQQSPEARSSCASPTLLWGLRQPSVYLRVCEGLT